MSGGRRSRYRRRPNWGRAARRSLASARRLHRELWRGVLFAIPRLPAFAVRGAGSGGKCAQLGASLRAGVTARYLVVLVSADGRNFAVFDVCFHATKDVAEAAESLFGSHQSHPPEEMIRRQRQRIITLQARLSPDQLSAGPTGLSACSDVRQGDMANYKRLLATGILTVALVLSAAWYFQSELIGFAAKFYLQRVAASEEIRGDLTLRRRTVHRLHRQILIAPPPDRLVPELFDFVTQLSARTASGEISLAWGAYLYTTHVREALLRPAGSQRPSAKALAAEIQQGVDFFYLQKRPDVDGLKVNDLWGDGIEGESFTLEEIRQAAREGRDLTRE